MSSIKLDFGSGSGSDSEPYFIKKPEEEERKKTEKRKGNLLSIPPKLLESSKQNIKIIDNYIKLIIDNDKPNINNSIQNINIELKEHDYEIQDYISSGNFGAVYSAKKLSTNDTDYVIKIITDDNSFINEINMLSNLLDKCRNCESCPEFICFVQGLKFNNVRFIVYKNAGVDLKTYLEKNKDLSNDIKKYITDKLINAINRLHSEFNIFHGDIKLNNITIFTKEDGSLQVKLIDFGVSSDLNVDFDNWPNYDNYNIEENKKLSVKYMNKDLNKQNKIIAEMNVVTKLIKEKLGIQADKFQIKYLKYKLKYLALRNKISQ
jgi:serine/threonine protein kinase